MSDPGCDVFAFAATRALSEEEVEQIFSAVARSEGQKATIDLPAQTITLHEPAAMVFEFDIEKGSKERLMGGLDDIALTLQHEEDIDRFEAAYDPMLSGNR